MLLKPFINLISFVPKPINVVIMVIVLLKKSMEKYFCIKKIDVQKKLRPKGVGSKKIWVKKKDPKNLSPKNVVQKN